MLKVIIHLHKKILKFNADIFEFNEYKKKYNKFLDEIEIHEKDHNYSQFF